jgi:hypothetical protein
MREFSAPSPSSRKEDQTEARRPRHVVDAGEEHADLVGMMLFAFGPLNRRIIEFVAAGQAGSNRIKQAVSLEQASDPVRRPCPFGVVAQQPGQILCDDTLVDGRTTYAVGGAIDDQAAQVSVAFRIHGQNSFGRLASRDRTKIAILVETIA